MCFASQRPALFRHLDDIWTTSGRPKVVRTRGNFQHFDSRCASRHSKGLFFDISMSQSGPTLRCFVHFDLQMCFAPHSGRNCSSLICRAGSAPAALASLLFNLPEPHKALEKHSVSRLSYLFAPCIFSLLTFYLSDLLHLLSSPF